MHEGTKPSNYETGSIEFGVGQTQGSDHPVAPTLRWSQRDKEHLIFIVVDNVAMFFFQLNLLLGIQVALENRILQMVAEVATGLEHLAQPLVVGDVVTN